MVSLTTQHCCWSSGTWVGEATFGNTEGNGKLSRPEPTESNPFWALIGDDDTRGGGRVWKGGGGRAAFTTRSR
jgi:hypothetical protein